MDTFTEPEELFICILCWIVFTNWTDCLEHLYIKHNACKKCYKLFTQKGGLNRHIKSVHDKVKYPCEKCGNLFTKKTSLDKHIESVHNKVKHPCKKCDKLFNDKSNLDKHIESVHSKVKHPCEQCGNLFSDKSGLNNHIKSIHNKIKHPCEQCGNLFSDKSGLNNHIKNIHSVRGEQRKRKSEESMSKQLVKMNFVFERENRIDFKCAIDEPEKTCSKVDFVIHNDRAIFFVENDENQHRHYPIPCELRRMTDTYHSICLSDNPPQVPVVWIRFNPDKFKVNGTEKKASKEERFKQLEDVLLNYKPSCQMEVIYMFYDSITGDDKLKPAIFNDSDYFELFKPMVTSCVV